MRCERLRAVLGGNIGIGKQVEQSQQMVQLHRVFEDWFVAPDTFSKPFYDTESAGEYVLYFGDSTPDAALNSTAQQIEGLATFQPKKLEQRQDLN